MTFVLKLKTLFIPSKEYALLLLLILVYIGSCYALALYHGISSSFHPLFYLKAGTKISLILFLSYFLWRCFRALFIMVTVRPQNLVPYLWEDLKEGPFRADRYKNALPVFLGFLFFFSSFSSIKMLIPRIVPYSWDGAWVKLDNALHFGFDPWQLLHPLLGYPFVTFAINFIYILWLGMLFFVLYWQLFSIKNPKLRLQFFFSFVLSWALLGTGLALLFSSVGPCFYERLTGDVRFAELMAYLRHVHESFPIWALDTQDTVWKYYTENALGLGGGISAMPSIHVATAFLFMLLGWKTGKTQGIVLSIFFALIMIGSVHLGWHYAVDGYLSIILASLIWLAVGKIIERHNP